MPCDTHDGGVGQDGIGSPNSGHAGFSLVDDSPGFSGGSALTPHAPQIGEASSSHLSLTGSFWRTATADTANVTGFDPRLQLETWLEARDPIDEPLPRNRRVLVGLDSAPLPRGRVDQLGAPALGCTADSEYSPRTPRVGSLKMEIPKGLVDEINAGECVAFVGAGFSGVVVPPWGDLLLGVLESTALGRGTRDQVQDFLADPGSKELEAAAQILRDELGADAFAAALEGQRVADIGPRMQRRLELLHGIPFRAVLTTNFDGLLEGPSPGREAYQEVLRPSEHRWWDARYWDPSQQSRSAVMLHGSLSEPAEMVFTRRDYRRRLYSTPGYLTFVRSVMATTTVLYLGFSFTDAYLDELRSEILALLEHRGTDKPIAYALLNATDAEVSYARRHEGIHVLPYSSANDFQDFDNYLEAIHRDTNPQIRLGELMAGARILWVDPDEDSIAHGLTYLQQAAARAGGRAAIEPYDSSQSALDALDHQDADLVISRWGYGEGPDGLAVGEHLLIEMRRRDLRAPVVVFASGAFATENKRAAMALGAASYEFQWQGLFREIERIFTSGSQYA
jgi:hypothetical protein